jgi:ribosomal protein S8
MYYNIINLIKMGYLYKKKNLKIKIYKNQQQLLKILIQLNMIKFLKKIDNYNNYMIYLTYVNNKPIFSNIKNLYKPSKIYYITLKNLIKFNKNNRSIILMSTNKGVMTNFEAINLKCGGILIAKLSN